ncbi:MAG TPA: M14 family metallopeptidase [Gemmatimonadota bacterium]|nr:M14 family metallopeptidase [Gemmatimonadota bacterium]
MRRPGRFPGFLVPAAALLAVGGLSTPAAGQEGSRGLAGALRTRAESTEYVETSSYDDVVTFLNAVAEASPDIHVGSFGYSYEGRRLPLAVWGAEAATPEEARATGRTRVLVMANIHAGEVEGKEAVLEILRAIAGGEHAAWRDSLVLLIAPIYNADGNERVRLDNRPDQLGPVGGMGQRPNAQGFDLNRDYMKLETPEARSLVRLFTEYDPHVTIDLHTTNGTYHGYHLTYAPPLHPGTDPGVAVFARERWLPDATAALAPEWSMWHYGNLPQDDGFEAPRGWYTFSHQPRFGSNYEGLRNRFGLLSEAYSYLPFEERIAVTHDFVVSLLDFATGHASEIWRLTDAADAMDLSGAELPVRAEHVCGAEVEILMGEVAAERHPYTGRRMLRRLAVQRPQSMPDCTSFRGTETSRVPAMWIVPADLRPAIDLLAAHGVRMLTLVEPLTIQAEAFAITSSTQAEREFQQHRERTLEGRWEARSEELPAGTVIVPSAQPLGRLAFYLLDPRSDDGLTAWNVLDEALEGVSRYPILRAGRPLAPGSYREAVAAPTTSSGR